jgi:hypothetical protein
VEEIIVSAETGKKQNAAQSLGTLLFELRASSKLGLRRLRLRIKGLTIVANESGILLLSNRWIEVDPRAKTALEFALLAPAGKYSALELAVSDISIQSEEGAEQALGDDVAVFELKLQVRRRDTLRLLATIDIDALARGKPIVDAVGIRILRFKTTQTFIVPDEGMARFELKLPGSEVDRGKNAIVELPPHALPSGAKVTIRALSSEGMPALFGSQRIVGPVVEVLATDPIARSVAVTLPYDPSLLAASGTTLDGVIIMQWDDTTATYRELQVARADPISKLITIQTQSFSAFFPSTAGIDLLVPELEQDIWGRAVGLTSGSTATIAGRTSDDSAWVALLQPHAPRGWTGLGWFDFEGVPLQSGETTVVLEARIDGKPPHTCEFTMRRPPPPKRITAPSRHYGPHLIVFPNNAPLVSAVVIQTRFTNDDIFPPLADWQVSFSRHGPYVYMGGADGSDWVWEALLPESFFENEAARFTIRAFEALVPIPVNANAPENVRALSSLADFLNANSSTIVVQSVLQILNFAANPFRAGTLSLSPIVPLVALDGQNFGAAFVAATLEGVDAADRSSLQDLLRTLHGSLADAPANRPQVFAGRLFFVSGSFGGDKRREVVGDGIWCARLALRIDPVSDQPVIAAVGVLPDQDKEPLSTIRLFRRRPDGTWSDEQVLGDRAVVDLDLAIDPDGDIRIVAGVGSMALGIKTQLILIRSNGHAWTSEPIVYGMGENGKLWDRGISPRIHIDESGRSVVVAGDIVGAIGWTIAIEDNGTWRSTFIKQASEADVTGSQISSDIGPLGASGLSLAHWAPAIVPDASGSLWCAYSNGILNLARIDLNTLKIEDGPIEVDRETGYYPSLALRSDGAPAVAFKDPYGPGISGLQDLDDLFFLSVDDGNVVPGGSRFAPELRPYTNGYIDLAAFGSHVPLDCANVTNPSMLPAILASIVMGLRWDLEILPSGGWYWENLAYRNSHPKMAQMIEGLPRRPTIGIFKIDNSDFPSESIASITITSFSDPLFTVDLSIAADLDNKVVSDALVRAFAGQNIALHKEDSHVDVSNQGSAWDLTDDEAFGIGINVFSQLYQIRKADNGLEVRIPPVISVLDRTGNVDEFNRPKACGLEQDVWDISAKAFLDRFTGFTIGLPVGTPGRMVYAELTGLNVSAYEPWDPASPQQGGIRLTIEIPSLYVRNEDPGINILLTEPSYIYIALAPFSQDGHINWWVREASLKMGHLSADVDVSVYGWVQWLMLIPGADLVAFGLNPFLDSYATSTVNDQLKPPGTNSLQGLLAGAMQTWLDDRLSDDRKTSGTFEAIYLRQFYIRTWMRDEPPDSSEQSLLGIEPTAGLDFGSATIGAAAVQRYLLLSSDGGVPVFLEDVQVSANAPEFSIVSTASWPKIIASGSSLTIRIAFQPAMPPGFRASNLLVTANGVQPVSIPIRGLALSPPAPSISTRPAGVLNFGFVVAGQQSLSTVELFDEGAASLAVAVPRVVGDATFTIVGAAPLSIPAQGSVSIQLVYAPPRGSNQSNSGRLILDSNDPDRPHIEIELFGVTAAGMLLVMPTTLAFADTPLDGNIPPLPPGVPPTVHRGSTLATSIINTGAASLTVLAPSFQALDATGAISKDFRLWNVDGSQVQLADQIVRSGAILTLVVQFLPITAGLHNATIGIRSDDPTQPLFTVNLSGTAIG